MPKYRIKITAIPDTDGWDDIDRETYEDQLVYYKRGKALIVFTDADSEDEALDEFHNNYPIHCLDDWDIDVQIIKRNGKWTDYED